MSNEREQTIVQFINSVGITCDKLSSLENTIVDRDILLDDSKYSSARTYLPQLKLIFSSSSMTALQEPATSTQKWPLLNLVRQVLKACGFVLTPSRISEGYDKDKKKKFRRIFTLTRNVSVKESEDSI
jgi:hypothetical protein